MKQEDKELLLQDLCGRIPYGVKLNMKGLIGVSHHTTILYGKNTEMYFRYGCNDYFINEVKPYLFPISSMTEEQKKEYYSLADDVTVKPGQGCYLGIKIHCIKLGISDNPHEEVWDYIDIRAIDWLNKNHFDYRDLIPKGLAIDCTNLNIY